MGLQHDWKVCLRRWLGTCSSASCQSGPVRARAPMGSMAARCTSRSTRSDICWHWRVTAASEAAHGRGIRILVVAPHGQAKLCAAATMGRRKSLRLAARFKTRQKLRTAPKHTQSHTLLRPRHLHGHVSEDLKLRKGAASLCSSPRHMSIRGSISHVRQLRNSPT